MPPRVRLVCLAFALLGLGSGAAQAQVVTEFSAGITPGARLRSITTGPDGNLWFIESDGVAGNRIGRITPLGIVTEFDAGISSSTPLVDIAAGSDGNLWFPHVISIGRITTLGVITELSAAVAGDLKSITAGPDGNLWFTEFSGGRIGRITTGAIAPPASTTSVPALQPWALGLLGLSLIVTASVVLRTHRIS